MSRERPFQDSKLELDDERCEAFWKGQRLELSRESYTALKLLARSPGEALLPFELIDAFLEDENIGRDYSKLGFSSHIKLVRVAFEEIDPLHQFIETIPRWGYKWSEP